MLEALFELIYKTFKVLAFIFIYMIISLFLVDEYTAFKYNNPYQSSLRSSEWINVGSDERFEKYKVSLGVTFTYKEFRGKNSHYDINVLDKNGNKLFTINDKQSGLQEAKLLNGVMTFMIYEEKETGDTLIFERQNVLISNKNK